MWFHARTKVIIGFFLAICLIVGVVAVTFTSVKKLLDSVESLSVPNEKLRNLNYLLSDIYQLDKSRSVFIEKDTANNINYFHQIQSRIKKLQSFSSDSAEANQVKKIGHNVNELLVVYKGLEEVKKNLYDRNFSKEALTNIERKIRRKEELSRLQSLGKIRIGISNGSKAPDSTTTVKPIRDTREDNAGGAVSVVDKVEIEKLMTMLRENLNRMEPNAPQVLSSSDSVIYAVRQIVSDINNEEQYLRSRLSFLEQELNNKNKELIINIQNIVTSLQDEAISVSKSENKSAYELSYQLSLLLGILIIVGIIGFTGFIFSIVREIKKSETYQKKLTEAKNRSDNLAKTKQDFLASMSHEIRHPLHVIQGYNNAMAKTYLEDEQREYVKMISFASGTLLGIVNDILDFSKLEAGKIKIERTTFDPKILFNNIRSYFKRQAEEKGIDFELNLSIPEEKWLKGDELRINQILNNLISNAIKFTERGKVIVSVQYFDLGKLVMKVEDTGMGMTDVLKKSLFTEFNQGDGSISRKFGGTGLGLAIVKKLVDLQQGTIKVESEAGKGTSINVVLPSELLEPDEKERTGKVLREGLKGLKILLIDDDQIGLKFSSLMIKGLGAEVTAYAGGVSFKKNFREEDFDFVLLDLQMPEIDGYQVLDILRNRPGYKYLPIVAMTANVFANEKDRMEKEGFDGILLKPFGEKEILQKVNVLLKDKVPFPLQKQLVTDTPAVQKPLYDMTQIKEFCMGDEAMFKEIVEGFYTQTGIDLIRINKALDEGDFDKIQSIAHQLSSRLGQFKIIEEGKLVKSIEIALKKGDKEGVKEKIWALTERLNYVLEDIVENYRYAMAN